MNMCQKCGKEYDATGRFDEFRSRETVVSYLIGADGVANLKELILNLFLS